MLSRQLFLTGAAAVLIPFSPSFMGIPTNAASGESEAAVQ